MRNLSDSAKQHIYRASIVAGVIGAAVFLLGGLFWQKDYIKEQEQVWHAKADAASDRIARAISNRLDQAKRLAISTSNLPLEVLSNNSSFQSSAGSLVGLSGHNSVAQWADHRTVITQIVPLEGNEAAMGLNLLAERPAVRNIINTRQGAWEGPFKLVQGGTGLIYRTPRYDKNGILLGLGISLLKLPNAIADLPALETYADNENDIHPVILLGSSPGELQQVYADKLVNQETAFPIINRWTLIPRAVDGRFAFSDLISTGGNSSAAPDYLVLEVKMFRSKPMPINWPARTESLIIFACLFGVVTGFFVLFQLSRLVKQRQETELQDLRKIMDRAVYGKSIFDQRGNLVWANRALYRIAGATVAQLENTNVFTSNWWTKTGCDAIAKTVMTTGEDQVFEYVGPMTHADHVDVRMIFSRISISNSPHLFVQLLDMTADHQLLEEVKASAQAKQEFLSVVSHEVRTPLNGVLGMLEVLSRYDLNDKAKYCVEVAKDSGQLLLRIVNDILDYSKMEARQLDLDPVVTSLPSLVDNLNAIISNSQTNENVIVLMNLDPALVDRNIIVDDSRLLQVLVNLTNNAVKFTETGRVTVSIELQPSDNRSKATIKFTVVDTGIGMGEQMLKKLFTPFTQADSGHTRKYGGTGLGLAISRRLVQAMNSEIVVTSELGVGSTFSFTIVVPFEKEFDSDTFKDEKPLDGLSIMVVDDMTTNRIALVTMLEDAGAEVFQSSNGYDALKQLDTLHGSIDIVLMDIQMPMVDGLETTRLIRAKSVDQLNRLPIVAVTGNGSEFMRKEALASGMDDVLIKPVGRQLLVNTILQHIRA